MNERKKLKSNSIINIFSNVFVGERSQEITF